MVQTFRLLALDDGQPGFFWAKMNGVNQHKESLMNLKACGRMTSLDRTCRLGVGLLLLVGAFLSLKAWFYGVLGLILVFSASTGQCLMAKWIKEIKK